MNYFQKLMQNFNFSLLICDSLAEKITSDVTVFSILFKKIQNTRDKKKFFQNFMKKGKT